MNLVKGNSIKFFGACVHTEYRNITSKHEGIKNGAVLLFGSVFI